MPRATISSSVAPRVVVELGHNHVKCEVHTADFANRPEPSIFKTAEWSVPAARFITLMSVVVPAGEPLSLLPVRSVSLENVPMDRADNMDVGAMKPGNIFAAASTISRRRLGRCCGLCV